MIRIFPTYGKYVLISLTVYGEKKSNAGCYGNYRRRLF